MAYIDHNKRHRDFSLKVGLADNEFGRLLTVVARSSLEAGLIIVNDRLIPANYVAHSLIDGAPRP